MSSMASGSKTGTDAASTDECGIHDLPAEIKLEICSYLEVHDQLAVGRVCKRWRSNVSKEFWSKCVDLDVSNMPNQPEKPEQLYYDDVMRYTIGNMRTRTREEEELWNDLQVKHKAYLTVSESRLEHALNLHLQKNTRILILRHVAFEQNQFSIVVKAIKEKEADLIQLILKDCHDQENCSAYWWLKPELLTPVGKMCMHDLISVTRRLILDNFTMRNVMGNVCVMPHPIADVVTMRGSIYLVRRFEAGYRYKSLPIVLSHHEFDRSKPLLEQYPSFMMALNSSCPEVSAKVRDDVVQLYNSWKQWHHLNFQWEALGVLIKSLNKGLSVIPKNKDMATVDIEALLQYSPLSLALQQLDPLTLNKLTVEALHRIFCLPCECEYPGCWW